MVIHALEPVPNRHPNLGMFQLNDRGFDPTIRTGELPHHPKPGRRTALVLAVWLAVAMLSASGLLAMQSAIGLDHGLLSLVMFAPAIGAAICWLTVRGDIRPFPPKTGTAPFATSLVLSLVAVAVVFLVLSVARGSLPTIPAEVAGAPVGVMILLQSVGSLGEEIGYRGLLLNSMYTWLSQPRAAILVGILFGLWHIQYYGLPLMQFLAFIVGCVALTLTMAYVMTGSFWQRMASCTVIHTGANLALAFTGTDRVPMTTFSAAVIISALIVIPVAVVNERRNRRVRQSTP